MISAVTQRWRDRSSSFRSAVEVINPHRFEVASIADDNTAKRFVERHHYSASYPAARFRFGLFERGVLVGVAVFSHPCNALALRPLPTTLASTELGRFVLLDRVPGNGETWFLARAFELLRREGIGGVVSFSDPMPRSRTDGQIVFGGHVGTIYQAHNATYLGRARCDTVRLLPDGRSLPNRAVAKLRQRDKGWRYVRDQLIAYGAVEPENNIDECLELLTRKFRHPGNHKYVWAFDRSARRALPKSKPYPKGTFT